MTRAMLSEIAAHHRTQAQGLRAHARTTASIAPNSADGLNAMAEQHETWARELKGLADAFAAFIPLTQPDNTPGDDAVTS